MPTNDLERLMWAEACRMLDRAEHLQRQFFRPRGREPAWEPPVDVYEIDGNLLLVVALPGVDPQSLEVRIEGGELIIHALRQLPAAAGSRVRRLEIPHGHFQRRLSLPAGIHRLDRREWIHGCLHLYLTAA